MSARRAAVLALALAALQGATGARAQLAEGRWQLIEQCPGQRTQRSYVLTSDGTMLTARLSGTALDSFGTILGFTPLLPGGRFSLDIAVGGAEVKATYTGRIRPDGTLSAEGGLWSGANFTACQARVTRLGASAGRPEPQAMPPGGATAGRPEPIPPSRPSAAGRPEPIPAAPPPAAARPPSPQAAAPQPAPPPAAAAPSAGLPPCEEAGPAPSALGPDGTWRPTCVPRGAAAARPVPAPTPAAPPPAAPPPAAAPTPAPSAPAMSETERMRQQLEEERRRREAAERALRLNEALGRQGRN